MGFCRKVAMLLGNRDAFYTEQALLREAVFEDGEGFGDAYPILTTCPFLRRQICNQRGRGLTDNCQREVLEDSGR